MGRPVIYPFDALRAGDYFDVNVAAGSYAVPSAAKPLEAYRSWKKQRGRRKHKRVTTHKVLYTWLTPQTIRFYVPRLNG